MNLSPMLKSACFSLLITSVINGQSATLLPYPDAVVKAKAENKDIIVLTYGSDWMPETPALTKAYETMIDKSPLSDKVIWALNDEKTGQTEQEKKQPKPPLKVWYYPGLQVVDSQGRGMFVLEKLSDDQILKAGVALKKAVEEREKRDEFWKKAETQTGDAAVESWAKGLELVPENSMKAYKKQLDLLLKSDPTDAKGYHTRFTFQAHAFMEREINALIKEKKFAEALQKVNDLLKRPALTKYQKQVISTARFRIAYKQGNLAEGLKYLKQAVAIDPQSEFSTGILRLYDYYSKPVVLSSLSWSGETDRPEWTPTSVKVKEWVKEPGTYQIKFERKGSGTRFRNPSFKSGNKVLASIRDDKKGDSFELTLPSSAPANIVLEVEAQGSGWFGGKGNIVITKKS